MVGESQWRLHWQSPALRLSTARHEIWTHFWKSGRTSNTESIKTLDYYACVNDHLLLPLADMEPHFIDMIEHNFDVLKSNFTHAGARLRADYHIGNSRYSIFGEMQYGITLCSNHETQNHIVFSLGVHI